jgi:hypothetical protein
MQRGPASPIQSSRNATVTPISAQRSRQLRNFRQLSQRFLQSEYSRHFLTEFALFLVIAAVSATALFDAVAASLK